MNKQIAIIAACSTLLGALAPLHASIVINGSFETPDIGTFEYSPTGSGWTFSGAAGIIDAPSAFGAPDPPPHGEQLAFLQVSIGTSVSSFSQSISVPSDGLYTLTFFDAGRPFGAGAGNVPYNVLIDSAVIHTDFTVSNQPFTFNSTLPFAVTAGSHDLEFRATHGFTGDNTAFFDSIAIAAIPESSSFALIGVAALVGVLFGAIGVKRRRAA